jgi:very-short-patch-repair endonuclease
MSSIEFIKQATEAHKGKYDYSKTKYVNCYSRIIIICPVHGEFEQLATHHLHAKGNCPKCQVSRGEQKIADYLNTKCIKYIWEYRIENQLRFDFYLPDINVAIEYDGEQHFKPILYYGGHDKLKETQQRDKKKNRYCQKVGIKLIRIPYTEFDKIDKILQKELNVT